MRKYTIAFAALALLGTPVHAAPPTAKAGTYTIDPHHTQIIFEIRHMGLSTFYGRFGAVSGTLTFDPATPEKSTLSATVDMTNIQTHVDELDKELRDDVFHAEKFPTATFTGTQIVKTGDNTGTLTGNLTLAGVTKPVTLDATFEGGGASPLSAGYAMGFKATAMIRRTDFGITGMGWEPFVSDDVNLIIEATFNREKN